MKIANSNLKDQRKAITQCVNLGKQKVPLKKNHWMRSEDGKREERLLRNKHFK